MRRVDHSMLLLLLTCCTVCGEQPKGRPCDRDIAIIGQPLAEPSVPLHIHFHGKKEVVEAQLGEAGWQGILLVVNCHGLSSTYRIPYSDRERFRRDVDQLVDELARHGRNGSPDRMPHVTVSSFSAGYAAIREILQHQNYAEQIDAVICLDSIYASIHTEGNARLVAADQMRPFVTFGRRAVRGKKRMVVTHSALETPDYASTVETSDYLIKELQLPPATIAAPAAMGMATTRFHSMGGMFVIGYEGSTGPDHMRHLTNSRYWFRYLQGRDSE